MNKLPISVCIISGAEARRIGVCLESVAAWAAEIVVVLNADVEDGTEEICRKYGARIFREAWKGHVAQKNSAADKAAQEWILGLDADEAISTGLRLEIARTLASENITAKHDAFGFPRMTFYLGRWIRHGDWYPDRKVRLWRRGRARWGGENPHDKLVVDGTVGDLQGDMLHYTNPTISSYVDKINYFSDLFLQQQIAKNARWSAPESVFRAVWRFARSYFIRLGFLDGYPGFFIAASTAYSTLVRHTRLYEHLQSSQPSCVPPKSP